MKKINAMLVMSAMMGMTLASCSSDDATGSENNSATGSIELKLAQPTVVYCSSNDIELGQYDQSYYKVQDYENTTKEHMPAVYAKFVDYAPKKGNGEAVTDEEKNFVLNYLDEHPNEGSTEFNHYNYFIQYVGGVNREYDTTKDQNGADHKTGKSTSQMDYIEFVDQNGKAQHINDYNANGGPRALVLNCKITTAQYHDSWGDKDNTHSDKYRFYTIEYNGQKNLYLCYDYATAKTSGEFFGGDGKYNDYVIKIIPGCGSDEETTEPTTPGTTEPTTPGETEEGNKPGETEEGGKPGETDKVDTTTTVVTPKTGEIEVNFAVQDHKDENASKLAVHVRDTADFKVFIPVSNQYYCSADDMYIVEKHYENMTYNVETTTIERVIDGQTVTLNVTYTEAGIYVESEGINAKALQYCRNVYGDGITFEVYNYYNDKLNRQQLIELLNQSTIEFKNAQPKQYINTIVEGNTDEEGLLLDCAVTNKD